MKVIQIRDVPDDVHDALVAAARAEGLSLTRYMVRELGRLVERPRLAERNAAIIRDTQSRVAGNVGTTTILTALHEGREE